MTVSDDEDERLAEFLESEVLLSQFSDQEEGYEDEVDEEIKEEEEEREEEERKAKRMKIEEDGDDINEEVKSMGLLSSSSLSIGLIADVDSASSPCKDCEEADDALSPVKPSEKSVIVASSSSGSVSRENRFVPRRIETGIFSKVPPELFPHILKFLSSEDLVACSLVCRFLNHAASDESLWRRLYCMRWGLLPPTKKLRECAWKKLYIQRDEEDMVEFVRNSPSEFKEYYIQMQVAKRSQAPLPSQVNDDRLILDKTVADQVSIWKRSRGLSDKVVVDHVCSGERCTYHEIGDVFVCEQTGNVHVCDDTCREVIADPTNELLVCTISGHCYDRLLSPSEMEPDAEQQQGGITDDAEPFMGSGRFARAYLLGYNCADERELEHALRFC